MNSDLKWRGVYGCFVGRTLRYVGSSSCGIEKLEHNHKNWQSQYGESGRTKFRTILTENPEYKDCQFKWLIAPAQRTVKQIEELEGQTIRLLKPPLNVDYDPVASSIKYGRYS